MPTQRRKLYPKKSKKLIFQQSKQKVNHTNIEITSKVRGANNHFLKPLNMNGHNSPINRHRITIFPGKSSILLEIMFIICFFKKSCNVLYFKVFFAFFLLDIFFIHLSNVQFFPGKSSILQK